MRSKLSNDATLISDEVHGAQSVAISPNKIRSIVRHGISDQQRSSLLCRMIDYLQCKKVLELGTSVGINTAYLSMPDSVEQVVSVDANSDLIAIAKSVVAEGKSSKIQLINSDVDEYLDMQAGSFDLVYLDADHTYEATMRYVQKLVSRASQNGIIVLDDIHWSVGMERAWEDLRLQHKLTIERFNLGIIFMDGYEAEGHLVLDF